MGVDDARRQGVTRPVFVDYKQERVRPAARFGMPYVNDLVRFVEKLNPVVPHFVGAPCSPAGADDLVKESMRRPF